MSELKHHGILGQKWGVRRYQNSDGSLTKAGKTRYEKSKDRSDYEELAKKPLSAMSNAELRKYNERSNLESQYYENNKKNISAGKAFVKAVAIAAVTAVTVKVVSNGMEYVAKQGFKTGGVSAGKLVGKIASKAGKSSFNNTKIGKFEFGKKTTSVLGNAARGLTSDKVGRAADILFRTNEKKKK